MTKAEEFTGRIALVCTECSTRVFDDASWRCPRHPQKTAIQRNRPYMGEPVETIKIRGLKVVDPGK